jgi:hypothetical protein
MYKNIGNAVVIMLSDLLHKCQPLMKRSKHSGNKIPSLHYNGTPAGRKRTHRLRISVLKVTATEPDGQRLESYLTVKYENLEKR